MINNGSAKIALVITAVVGMLVGSVGLTAGLMNGRADTITEALAINASRKVQSVIDEQRIMAGRVTIIETNYKHIIALLEKIEDKIEK